MFAPMGFGMMPMGGMGMMNPMLMGPMGGLMIGMQMMQMMQMLQMMMGQMMMQQQMMGMMGGGCGPGMADMMGMNPMMGGGYPQMPFGGGGCCPQGGFQGYNPCCPYGGQPNFGCGPANPNQCVPSCGPCPSKQQIGQSLDAIAAKYGVPPQILKAVAYKESGWNPNCVGDHGQSHGMMQIYSTAHPDYNVARGMQDPNYNIEYAAQFLSRLGQKYHGNWAEAVRAYNGAGPAAQAYSNSVMQLAQQQPWHRFGVA